MTPAQPAAVSEDAVAIRDLHLTLGRTEILRGIDVSLARGKVLALLGPSGCGKTTLLRIIAGLLAPSRGEVRIGGTLVADAKTFLPPEKRGLGMVFQDYALWPHLDVAGNVAFPLEMRGIRGAECRARVMAALDRVGLAALADRAPSALSGGQQQRVAIARAIVAEPRVVLFDEPLSNLDRELRESMVAELSGLIQGLGLTAVYVTHDQSEALTLADHVAVMEAGRIAQIAAPEDLVEHPASPRIAEFLRLGAMLDARREGEDWLFGAARLRLAGAPDAAAARVLVTARALCTTAPEAAALRGEVTSVQFRDQAYAVSLRLDGAGGRVGPEVQLASPTRLRPGEHVGLEILSDRLRWFPAEDLNPA